MDVQNFCEAQETLGFLLLKNLRQSPKKKRLYLFFRKF